MGMMVTCDITGKPVSLNDGVLKANTHTGQWYFCAIEGEDQVHNSYPFHSADQIIDQESLIQALAQLGTKAWFKPELFFQKINQLKQY